MQIISNRVPRGAAASALLAIAACSGSSGNVKSVRIVLTAYDCVFDGIELAQPRLWLRAG
jgi:hypothetical protein